MSHNYVNVKIEEGSLRGEKLESIQGGYYCSFKGIPYGKPPVEDLRFKAPVPAEPWNGVRDALKHGLASPAIIGHKNEYNEMTSEDCLFLNVYTPQVPQNNECKPKAVLVWIHGGAFRSSSGNSDLYGPDFLMREDVVLVTINYRLGALGFLSLGTEDCPGNFGLKDCVLALKWVKRNISAFGGDPNNVTIFGASSGGASVQFLLVSKLAKGLFHKAITQSGTALDKWSITENPRDYAFALGEKLGCKTEDDRELLTFLKNAKPKDLVLAETDLYKMFTPDEFYFRLSFLPVVEPDGEGAFLTKTPEEIFRNGDVIDVPYITGVNSKEGFADWEGATHGDEVGYLFYVEKHGKLVPESPENLMVERITKLWTDFAKTGNPTPKDNLWQPISQKDITYLDIGDKLKMIEKLKEEPNKVWQEVFQLAM